MAKSGKILSIAPNNIDPIYTGTSCTFFAQFCKKDCQPFENKFQNIS